VPIAVLDEKEGSGNHARVVAEQEATEGAYGGGPNHSPAIGLSLTGRPGARHVPDVPRTGPRKRDWPRPLRTKVAIRLVVGGRALSVG
jgi:hypothetical protein